MDEEMIRQLIDHCLYENSRMEALFRQDRAEMEECTRGEILRVYQEAMDKGIGRAKNIRRLLEELRREYGTPQ